MATKSLQFLMFGEDVTASASFKKVATEAEASSARIKGAFGGAGSALLGAGLVAGLGLAVKAAGDFQQQTNVLVTAAGESASALAGIRKGILDISTATGTSWQQVTDGMYLLEKAGYRGADALKVETAAAEGAREENASLATVTQAMTSIMASYHLSASDSVMVMNELKTAAGESKTTMELFSGALSTVLPFASAANISFADVAGSMATLTQHGTSADEATQELANTIRNLAKPNAVAVKEMAQLGISSVDVTQKLGDGPGGRGLAGTLNYLSQTVLEKMGPAGTLLLNTFNQSQVAAADATTMFNALAPATQAVAQQFLNGSITQKEWTADVKAMSPEQANLARAFATTQNNAAGFQQTLKNGLASNQTYQAAMQTMLGGTNGLNVALQITGESMAGTNIRISAIAQAAKDAGVNVSGWESTQKLFNVQLDRLKASGEAAGIELGTDLLPKLTTLAEFIIRNKTQVELLVGGLIAYKVAALAAAAATAALELASGPVLIAILALAAGFDYAYTHSARFREAVSVDFAAISAAATEMKSITTAVLKDIVKVFLEVEENIIVAADDAFNWIPVLGPKLDAARADFNTFKDGVNASLNGIATPKKVIVDPVINTVDQANAWRQINGFKTRVEVPIGPIVDPMAGTKVHQILDAYKTRIQVPIGPIVDTAAAADAWRALNGFKTRIEVPIGPIVKAPGASANGTSYASGGPWVVGEQGPELVNLPKGSSVSTASASKGGLGGGDVHLHVTVQAGIVPNERAVQSAVVGAVESYFAQGGRANFRGASV